VRMSDVSQQLLEYHCDVVKVGTVKHAFFTCPLFCEFRNTGDFAKITGLEYAKLRVLQ